MRRSPFAVLSLLATLACTRQPTSAPPPEPLGIVRLAVNQIPADVHCLQLTVADALRVITRRIDVTPGDMVSTTQGGLPVGLVSLSVDAYAQTCSSLTSTSQPNWVSGVVQATLNASTPTSVTVNMTRPGSATIVVDFPSDGGATDAAGGFTFSSNDFLPVTGTPPLNFKSNQCHGTLNQSPALQWSSPPSGTQSFAVVLTDTSTNAVQWVIYDVAPSAVGLPANVSHVLMPPEVPGAVQTTFAGIQGYVGPGADCRTYRLELWAVDVAHLPAAGASGGTIRASILPAHGIATLSFQARGQNNGGLCPGTGPGPDAGADGPSVPLSLTSNDFITVPGTPPLSFKSGQTHSTGDHSPALQWSNVPAGAQSLAVAMVDTSTNVTQWVIYDVPPTATMLPASLSHSTMPVEVPGAIQTTFAGLAGYVGPGADCRTYRFELWALNVAHLNAAGASNNTIREVLLPGNGIASSTLEAQGQTSGALCGGTTPPDAGADGPSVPLTFASNDLVAITGTPPWNFKAQQCRNTGNQSPALQWSGAPAGTQSFAVSLFDTSVNNTQWVIYDINPATLMLPPNISHTIMPPEVPGAIQTSFAGSVGWFGPGADCRIYRLELWALNVAQLPAAGATNNAIRSTILPAHALGSGSLDVRGQSSGALCAPAAGPLPPTNLTATVTGGANVALAWTDASSNETGFRVERRVGAGAFGALITLPAGATSHNDPNLGAGTYGYRVVATGAPDSAPSNEVVVVLTQPTADAHVRSGTSAATNFGTVTPLEVKSTMTTTTRRNTFLRFSLAGVGANVASAKLRLFGNAVTTAKATTVHPVADVTWIESGAGGITWNTPTTDAGGPAMGAALATQTAALTGAWLEWDVTAYIQQQRTANASVVSLGVKSGVLSDDGPSVFQSREGTNKPLLVISSRP